MEMNTIKTKVKDFLVGNKETIGMTIGTGVMYALCRRFNIPLSFANTPIVNVERRPNVDFQSLLYSENPTKQAIISLLGNAEKSSFDRTKLAYANDICSLINEETESDVRAFAINALSRIANGMDFDTYKKQVSDLILNVAKKEDK